MKTYLFFATLLLAGCAAKHVPGANTPEGYRQSGQCLVTAIDYQGRDVAMVCRANDGTMTHYQRVEGK